MSKKVSVDLEALKTFLVEQGHSEAVEIINNFMRKNLATIENVIADIKNFSAKNKTYFVQVDVYSVDLSDRITQYDGKVDHVVKLLKQVDTTSGVITAYFFKKSPKLNSQASGYLEWEI